MSNKKIGLVADVHIGCRGGSHIWRSFIKSYLIDYMIPTFKENNITDILQLGDLMDVRRSLYGLDRSWIVNEFIPALRDNSLTFHTLTGNHDCTLKDITSHSNWSLWAEAEAGGCIKAYTKPQDVELSGLLVSICPWVSKENVDETIAHINNSEASINVGHWELSSFLLSKGSLAKTGTFDANLLMKKFEACYVGHYHTENYKKTEGGLIKYLGTPYCLDWGTYSDGTEHGLYLLDTLTQKLDFIPNPPDKSMFTIMEYNYSKIASDNLNKKYLDTSYLESVLALRGKVVRIEITDKSDSSHFKKFIAALRLVNCVSYNTVDLTNEIELTEMEVDPKKFQLDPLSILLDKVEDTEGINHKGVASKLNEVYTTCKNNSNVN